MNKNPFAPQPSYNPQQPPLPPGPPPPQPSQPDYSAYWAAAAAAAQPHAAPAYNVQWPGAAAPAPAAPPRPPPEQSSLYANYGYGGQQSFQWQQQQQQQHRPPQAPFQPPQPHIPPPQPQPYNPYQPQQAAAFAQPYVPQSAPAPMQPPLIAQQQYAPPQQHQQQRQFFPQQQRQHQPPPQQQQQHFGHGVHHTPPQHLPPAKRPKYDSSGQHNGRPQQQVPPPPQPQFQPPPAPPSGPMSQPSQMGGMFGGGRGGGQNVGPPGRGGGQAGRGSGPGRGRGGNMGNNRGGAGRGRGGGMYGGGRGGGQGGQQLKGHGSRGNFGGNRDYGNRRGGSFTGGPGGGGGGSGPHSHQQGAGGSSFRGRGQGHGYAHGYSRGGRHDGGGSGSGAFGSRDGMMSSSFASSQGSSSGKKEENRRTLTDFKIVGLEIQELGWSWNSLPAAPPTPKVEAGEMDGDIVLPAPVADAEHPSNAHAKEPVAEPSVGPVDTQSSNIDDAVVKVEDSQGEEKPDVPSLSNGLTEQKTVSDMPAPNVIPPPPSRIRIYFHTPVSPDDSHPIPHGSGSFSLSSNESAVRKGKRKKLEDDDGDLEERRAPPPPPGGHHERALSTDAVDRHSAAPSIAETASEGDWLMAAIVEDEGDDADGEDDLHVTQVEPQDGDGQPTGDGEPTGEVDANGLTAESENGNIGGAGSDLAHNHAGDTGLDAGERGESSVPEDPPGLSEGQAFDSAHDASAALAASAGVVDQLFSEGRHGSGSGASSSDTAMTAPEISGAIPHPEQQVPAPSAPSDAAAAPDDHKDAPVEAATDLAPVGSPAAAPPTSASSAGDSVVPPSHEPVGPIIAPPEFALPAAEPSADTSCSPDTQVPPSTQPDSIASSAEAESLPATQEISFNDDQLPTRIDDDTQSDSATQVETQIDEQPSADTSALISNTSTISTYGELNQIPVKTEPQVGVRTPSANRLSISYAGGSKRLVIDAEVVESLKVFRAESRIEVRLKLDKDTSNGLHGVLVESLSDSTKSYAPLEVPSSAVEADPTVPPFSKAVTPTTLLLLVHLDRERPLSEPKWVKSGDVQEWLKSMFGRMFWVAGDAAEGWEKKIEVIDPDPAPTIWTVLDGWAQNSTVGTQTERQRFLRTHMIETDNILEILLRLVRGERATPFSQSAPTISATSISGPLLNALSQGSAHGAQQTHVSLAVLAMFRMAVEYAKKAVGEDRGKSEVEERVGEIIRCLPSHLLHKSLEGIFKEWKVEKKGGR